jgi:hypothetical protein
MCQVETMKSECAIMLLAVVVLATWICLRPLFWLFYDDFRDNRAIKRENKRLRRRGEAEKENKNV